MVPPRIHPLRTLLALFAPLAIAACTTLGPTPGVTGTLPLPSHRAALELEVAALPGYYLNAATQAYPKGAPIPQARLLVEFGRALRGVAVGGRYVGDTASGGHLEPMLAYRTFLDRDQRLGAAVVASAAVSSGAAQGAAFEAARGAVEVAIDYRATPRWRIVELHLVGVLAGAALVASGTHCVDENGFGDDCEDEVVGTTESAASGGYVSGAIALALDGGRHLRGPFHGARLALHLGGGTMPRVQGGREQSSHVWTSLGLSLTLTVGARAR